MNFLYHYSRHFTGAFKFKNRQGRTFFWLCLLADVFLVSFLLALNPFGLLGRLLILLALLVIAGNAIQGGHRENGKNRTISPADSLQALRLCSRCPNGVCLNLASDRTTEVRQDRGYFGFS